MKPIAVDLVRRVNPVPDPDAVVNVAERERTLRDVLDAPAARLGGRARRPLRQPSRLLVAVVMALLGLGAVALAASGILTGTPYRGPAGMPVNHNPAIGAGIPVRGSAHLLALRVPDPAGGPPWGMRVLSTTRGLECVQVGRVVNGQLGVLGTDGVAGDDHRFHSLAPDLVQMDNCVTRDAHGHAFIGNETDTGYASGPAITSSCAYPGEGSGQPLCPANDRRMLAYGLLGPHAVSLTYRTMGHTVTETTGGGDGGYLVVGPAIAHGDTGVASGSPGLFPGALAVTYADGRSCRPEPTAGTCALNGYAPPKTPRVRLGRVRVHATIRHYRLNGSPFADLVIRFRAPVAITDIDRSFTLATTLPPACGATDYVNLDHDIRRGGPVILMLDRLQSNCPGIATARVELTETNRYLAGPDSVLASLAVLRFRLR